LPFGSHRLFLNEASGFGNALVSGWTANSVIKCKAVSLSRHN